MAKKFEATLLGVQEDKCFHFIANLLMVVVATLLFAEGWGTLIGIGLAAGLSVGKELYDEKYGTGWSWADLMADALGIVAGAIGAAWMVW